MSRWLVLSLLAGAIVTSCVLPDVEIDPDLAEIDDETGAISPGTAGTTGITLPPGSSGSSGAAGDDDDSDEMMPTDLAQGGSGGAASVDNSGTALGGTGGMGGSAAVGGTGGTAGSSGTGGTASTPPSPGDVIRECTQALDRETACISYCQRYIEACGNFPQANTYLGVADCSGKCLAAPWPVGDTTTGSGSICCRFLHATLAAQGLTSQNPHCFHAAFEPSLGATGGCATGAVAPAAAPAMP
jgi:hypothetical protein